MIESCIATYYMCEPLNCVYALFSTKIVHWLHLWSVQLVLWIMELTKVKKVCLFVPLEVNSAFALHYTKYKVYKYTFTSHSTYWMSRHISLNHHLTPSHSNYIHIMNDNIRRLDVYLHTQLSSFVMHNLHVRIKPNHYSDCTVFVNALRVHTNSSKLFCWADITTKHKGWASTWCCTHGSQH